MPRIIIARPSGAERLEVDQATFNEGFYPGFVYIADASGSPTNQLAPLAADMNTVLSDPTSAPSTTLRAAFAPKWKPSTAYAMGEPVVNPSGQLVTANSAFTSGASYSAANWTITAGGGTPTVNTVAAAGAAQTLIVGRNLLTLTGTTCTLTLPTLADGAEVTIRLKQDGSGNRSVTWPAAAKWPFDVPPVLQTAAGAADEFSLIGDGAVWRGISTGSWSS